MVIQIEDVPASTPHLPVDFREEVNNFEKRMISQALAETGGMITPAAARLGLSHQALDAMLTHRHKDIFSQRKPVRPRRKSIIKNHPPKNGKRGHSS